MIAWMQRHKKYLVITIWLSTIAFIGAGFVGWGQYDYGTFAKDAMVVGNVEVSKKDLSMRYQQVYSQFSAMTGGQKLEPELEKQIEQIAINSLVSEALFLNLAKEWNLRTTDEEIAVTIANIKAFQKDGKFDKQTYIELLKEKGYDPKQFEAEISKSLLTQKLQKLLSLPVTDIEKEAFTASYFSEDFLNIQVINTDEKSISVTEQEVKDFWQTNKAKYKSTPKYDVEILDIKPQAVAVSDEELKAEYDAKSAQILDNEGKKIPFEQAKMKLKSDLEMQKAKKEALKTFVEFKNGKIQGKTVQNIDLNTSNYPAEFNEQLASSKSGTYIKPISYNKDFICAKVVKVSPSSEMSFEQAQNLAKKDLVAKKAGEKLKADAANALKNFNGKPVGLVSRANDANISFLPKEQIQTVLSQIINSPKQDGFVIVQDKAIVYKISQQKLIYKLDNDVQAKMLLGEAEKYKNEILISSIMEKLKNLYKVDLINNKQGSGK